MDLVIIQTVSLTVSILTVIIISRERHWIFDEMEIVYPIYFWAAHSSLFYSLLLTDKYLYPIGVSFHDWSIILRVSLIISIFVPFAKMALENRR